MASQEELETHCLKLAQSGGGEVKLKKKPNVLL
jgi:hypothetical protein